MANPDQLRQDLTNQMLEELLKHVRGWIATLGSAGKTSNKKVNAATRVAAAKVGIDLVVKLMATSTTAEGQNLLDQLAALDEAPPDDDEESEDDGADPDGS